MKKIIAIVFASCIFAAVAAAQPRAVGIRGGYGVEASYQHAITERTFIEGDLGWAPAGINLVGIYDFVFASLDDFNFYAGPGLQFAGYGYTDDSLQRRTALNFGIAGQIGVEYQIPAAPINISVDWRPVFLFLNGGRFMPHYGALSLRYRF